MIRFFKEFLFPSLLFLCYLFEDKKFRLNIELL